MKRIIIPAGTVSGKRDYILEIPVDSYDQDENAIYILDDKSSRGSVKSLSDYFYDKDSRSQLGPEYAKQYSYQPNQNQIYQNQSGNSGIPYPSNYMLKQEYNSGNYQVENPSPDISQSAKYYYYKSLGFTESELHKLLAKNGQRRMPEVPSQRKQMRFNRMGVSDFSSLYEDSDNNYYQYDTFGKPVDATTENARVNGYDMSHAAYPNIPYNASTSFERNQYYYEDYPKEKLTDLPSNHERIYKQYDIPRRTTIPSMKTNTLRTNPSYTSQQNTAANAVSTKQIQNAYYQQRYYAKPVAKPKVASPSKTAVANEADQAKSSQNERTNSPEATYENKTRTIPRDESISSSRQMEGYQKQPQGYSRQPSHPQKRTYRTIPGTSVVSNLPDIRIRNPIPS